MPHLILMLISAFTGHAHDAVHHPHHHHQAQTSQHAGCTSSHWRRTMSAGEKWIARHESGMDPRAVNPSSGARELGQLLPSTLSGLHLQPTWEPCGEIHHMRVYINERYGNTANAIAFWRAHSWY